MLNDLSTLTNEVWSMIAEFPDYQVSNHGRVKHIYRNGREYILRPWLDRYGYLRHTFTEPHSAFIDW